MVKQSYLFNSSSASGAQNKSTDGSIFSVVLAQPIQIPQNAHNIRVSTEQAHIWNNIANISSAFSNNVFSGTYEDLAGTGTVVVTTTIPDGQYSLHALETIIKHDIINNGGSTTNEPFHFIGSVAESKTIIYVNNANTIIDFTYVNNCRLKLGFDAQTLGPYAADTYVTSENIATFNNVNQLQIHSDIVTNGIAVNGKYHNLLAQVPISVGSGGLINYDPVNPTIVHADELRGNSKSHVRCWLTNENNVAVNTQSEDWNFRIAIEYEV